MIVWEAISGDISRSLQNIERVPKYTSIVKNDKSKVFWRKQNQSFTVSWCKSEFNTPWPVWSSQFSFWITFFGFILQVWVREPSVRCFTFYSNRFEDLSRPNVGMSRFFQPGNVFLYLFRHLRTHSGYSLTQRGFLEWLFSCVCDYVAIVGPHWNLFYVFIFGLMRVL